jgi:hypothetical protein
MKKEGILIFAYFFFPSQQGQAGKNRRDKNNNPDTAL